MTENTSLDGGGLRRSRTLEYAIVVADSVEELQNRVTPERAVRGSCPLAGNRWLIRLNLLILVIFRDENARFPRHSKGGAHN